MGFILIGAGLVLMFIVYKLSWRNEEAKFNRTNEHGVEVFASAKEMRRAHTKAGLNRLMVLLLVITAAILFISGGLMIDG